MMHDLYTPSPLSPLSVAMLNVSSLFTGGLGGFDPPPGSTSPASINGLPGSITPINGMMLMMGGAVNGPLGSVEQVGSGLDGSSGEQMTANADLVDMGPYQDLTQIPLVWLTFVTAFGLVWILALTGNAMVIYTVWSNRRMHTVVNYYIVNLAVCDFSVGAFVLPMKLLELAAPASVSFMTDGLCTAMLYLQTIVVFASVLTLVATCVERYFAICDPLVSRMQLQSKRRAKRILLVVWLAPCIVAAPFVYPLSSAVTDTLASELGVITRTSCIINIDEPFRQAYYAFLFFTIYLLPLTFIGWTCYKITRCLLQGISLCRQGSLRRQDANRRKIAKMVMIVAIAFGVSWTPYFLVTIATQFPGANYMQNHNYFTTMLVINLCAFINSCVNPFIYVAMSTRFRNGFRRIVRTALCCCLFSTNAEDDPFCGAENLHIKPSNNNNQHKTNSASSTGGKVTNNGIVPSATSSNGKISSSSGTRSALCCPIYACRQMLTESVTSGCGYVTNALAPPAFATAVAGGLRCPTSQSCSSNNRYPVYVTAIRANNLRFNVNSMGSRIGNDLAGVGVNGGVDHSGQTALLPLTVGPRRALSSLGVYGEPVPRVASLPAFNDPLWMDNDDVENERAVELPRLQASCSFPDNSKESAI